MDPAPFLRGLAFPGTRRVPYPRANPEDVARLPIDTWGVAQIPAGVRLELRTHAPSVRIEYETTTDDLGFRGDGAGRTFQLWQQGACVDEDKAALGRGTARLNVTHLGQPAIVYLPEGMKPRIDALDAAAAIEPLPPAPRWVAYGDSIAEGWCASAPALTWTATVARTHGLDVINMGYAGAARGEIVSAEHVAALPADVITITHGTNCWTRIPHSVDQMRANTHAFLDVVRAARPQTPILVCSALLRPDGETAPNSLGATHAQLRDAMERAVRERSDPNLHLVEGAEIVDAPMLADGVHPNDDGHRRIAGVLGPHIAALAEAR